MRQRGGGQGRCPTPWAAPPTLRGWLRRRSMGGSADAPRRRVACESTLLWRVRERAPKAALYNPDEGLSACRRASPTPPHQPRRPDAPSSQDGYRKSSATSAWSCSRGPAWQGPGPEMPVLLPGLTSPLHVVPSPRKLDPRLPNSGGLGVVATHDAGLTAHRREWRPEGQNGPVGAKNDEHRRHGAQLRVCFFRRGPKRTEKQATTNGQGGQIRAPQEDADPLGKGTQAKGEGVCGRGCARVCHLRS